MDDLKFDDRRLAQLRTLRDLIREAAVLDSGSGVMERMRKVINFAQALNELDWGDDEEGIPPRDSFLQFLIRLSHAHREEGAK